MLKKLLISDGHLRFIPASSAIYETILFEPWGFSKQNILADLNAVCSDLNKNDRLLIGLALSKVFFGNRSSFIFHNLTRKFPSANICIIKTKEEFESFKSS